MTVQVLKCQCGDPICRQYTLSTQGPVGFTLEEATLYAAAKDLRDALENLTIAIAMGWDLDGVLNVARVALDRSRVSEPCGKNEASGEHSA